MSTRVTHSFNPAPILAGSRRKKAPGGVRATRPGRSMYEYTQKTVKGIGNERPRSLLGTSRDAERGDLTDLLGKNRIARRDRGSVGLQLGISDHVSGRYTHYVGRFCLRAASQDKVGQYLLVYSPLGSLNFGVMV